ncbi:MAG: hypothetical protein NVSMB60_09800 [Mycobacterium sp.]
MQPSEVTGCCLSTTSAFKRPETRTPTVSFGRPRQNLNAIAEHVLDTYYAVADRVQDDVDALQANVFTTSINADLERAYLLKREVIEMRRAVEPLVDSLTRLLTDYEDLVSLEVRRYIRDVRDRTQQITNRVTGYDDVPDSLLEAALGRVATQQNVDMRKISAWEPRH